MRTNIVLDEALLREAARYTQAKTKRALVAEALATFVAVKAAERRTASYRDRLARLQGELAGVKLGERPTAILRRDRER